ncbi:MAG: DUF2905 family protein, partial [Proteobacteria bacterium]|nr:DUF2905 family protein [Pseudomonadota bacterium]
MVKWLLAVLLILVLLEVFRAQFAKLGLGRLPGDFRFKHKGR